MTQKESHLVTAINEIVSRILVGNWECIDMDDGQYYYVIGIDEYYKHISDIDPVRPAKRSWEGPSPQIHKFFRALLAAPQPDYFSRAAKRLKETGVLKGETVVALKRLLQPIPVDDIWLDKFTPDQLDALANYFDAWLAKKGKLTDLPDGIEPVELEEARDKLYLRELANKFKQITSKLGQLVPLSFENDQLHEATRCWLYGFYRGSIVLSASALEGVLKLATKKIEFDRYDELISEAIKNKTLSEDEAVQARNVFRTRNRVVHKGWNPKSEDGSNVLAMTRGVISYVHERLDGTL